MRIFRAAHVSKRFQTVPRAEKGGWGTSRRKVMNTVSIFGKLLCIALVVSAQVCGQAPTAQISGTVRDTSGLVVTGAEIKVTQTATGLVRSMMSASDGDYVLPSLPIGPYLLEISKP